ncbi:MAG: DUF2067 family protein [Promethearchaeota archaeon]
MARTYKKEMVLRINTSNERDIFINLLERIKLADLYLSAKPGYIRLKLSGTRENVKMAISEIKHIHKQTKGLLYPDRQGLFNYEIGFLFREAGATIRVELLRKLLQYKGYKIDSSTSDFIKSDAPLQVIIDLIHSLNSLIRETDVFIKPKVVREQIAVLTVISDLDPFTILERALELGMIRKDKKEEDRYSFAVNINNFLKAFLSNHVDDNESI